MKLQSRNKKKMKINDGHYLELMDRLYVEICSIEDYLCKHPLTKKMKKVRRLIDNAGLSLAEAYQLVGEESYLKEESKNAIQKVILRRRKGSSD
jgi:hypothetical protein